jgi:hypothetical protein
MPDCILIAVSMGLPRRMRNLQAPEYPGLTIDDANVQIAYAKCNEDQAETCHSLQHLPLKISMV